MISLAGMLGDKSYTPQSGGQAAPQPLGRFNVADLMKQAPQKKIDDFFDAHRVFAS